MKIARFTEGGRTRLGIVTTDTDEIIDVGTADPSLPTDLGPLLAGPGLASVARTASSAPRLALSAVQLEAPIAQPPTFLAIGLNYADHVAESGSQRPAAPVVFSMITCWPRISLIRAPRIRPMTSNAPPAANGITMVIGRDG